VIELQGVCKHFGLTQALAPTSLRFEQGKTTVLIGPSGCGKSTVLRLIAGIIRPEQGTIAFAGTPLDSAHLDALRHRMGYVIQEGGLFPHLTVFGNVTIMAKHLRWPGERVTTRLQELAGLVRLEPRLFERYPAELSGGQRQRVSLMRALMLDPDVLLLDEPLGALDPMIRYQLQQELKAVFEKLGKTVIMVTHDIAEAGFFGDTLVLMRDGHIVQRGSLQQLANQPGEPFVEHFVSAQREPMRMLSRILA
jgi:osmoprotectant transport system ATP-binding protein